MAVSFPTLFLLVLFWSTELGAKGQELHSGHCRVQRAILQDLWRAFQAMRSTVQALDHNTETRLLRQEFFQNATWAEICYLNYSLLDFYLSNIFNNYHTKAAELGILRPFITLANNFFDILKKLQHCVSRIRARLSLIQSPCVSGLSTLDRGGFGLSSFFLCHFRGMFSLSENSQRKFQLFQKEFTKLNPEARLTKALGEVDILLSWMEKTFRP
ncbi:interleukin-24 [Sminthopsis crassicaudata]|uniref:interleukin-24 n=1 Tax=Sminthopsis crassicaudata TaxID=9301 RepID=UPI003D68286A